MSNLKIDQFLPWVAVGVFVICFAVFFPQWIFIADEISYINRAMHLVDHNNLQYWLDAVSGNQISTILADYPLGASFFLAPFVGLFGQSGLYLANVFYLLLSVLILYITIKDLDRTRFSFISYIFLCIPCLFYSRTVMSELPSLLLITMALYFYFRHEKNAWYTLFFGLTAGLSLWFRELNLLLFIIPAAVMCWRDIEKFGLFLGGFIVGLLPRLLSANQIYNDLFYLKDSGYSFSISHLSDNVALYAVIVIFMFPGMLYPLLQNRSERQKLINSSIWIYLLAHLLYGYNGLESSGVKAILLSSRFLIPALPLIILSWVLLNKSWNTRLGKIIPWLAIITTMLFHLFISVTEKPMAQYTQSVQSMNNENSLFFIDTSSPEILEFVTAQQYSNPLQISDIKTLENPNVIKAPYTTWYIIHQERDDTDKHRAKQPLYDEKLIQYVSEDGLKEIFASQTFYQQWYLYQIIREDDPDLK